MIHINILYNLNLEVIVIIVKLVLKNYNTTILINYYTKMLIIITIGIS